jgi:hypothetical protein
VELTEAGALLDPGPLALETGVKRLDSGQLLVAVRTDMYGCQGRMFEWWFRFAPDTRQYLWWHPLDHVSSNWRDRQPKTHIGSTHVIREKLGAGEPLDLLAKFTDPAELFGADEVAQAYESRRVSGIVYARSGIAAAGLDDDGRPVGVRLLHVARDTDWGMALRTRFWMGVDAPEQVPEQVGLGLMQHAYTEFHYLSKFLPSLYIAENRESEVPPFPW